MGYSAPTLLSIFAKGISFIVCPGHKMCTYETPSSTNDRRTSTVSLSQSEGTPLPPPPQKKIKYRVWILLFVGIFDVNDLK